MWQKIKHFYIFLLIFNWSIIFKNFYEKYISYNVASAKDHEKEITNSNQLFLNVGINCETNQPVIIPEKGLFQNILITGTIGTGKTSSAMYPFTEQLIQKNIGMLVLDVKGNFHLKLKEMARKYNRKVTVIELRRKRKIQPIRQTQLETICFSKSLTHNSNTFFKPAYYRYLLARQSRALLNRMHQTLSHV